MISSALLLTALAAHSPTDVTPLSLATRLNVVEAGSAAYDWTLQQATRAKGVQLADTTATCDTGPTCKVIAGKEVCVPDCRFITD